MRAFLPSLLLVLVATGCSDSGSPDITDKGDPTDNNNTSTDRSTYTVEGDALGAGTVTAMRRSGESWEEVGSATVDASGHFQIEADAEDEGEGSFWVDLLVAFEGEDGSSSSVIVGGEVSVDGTLCTQDMDSETSAEASVYTSVVADGYGDEDEMLAWTRLLVDANVAAALDASSDDGDVDDAANLVVAAVAALQTSFDGEDGDGSVSILGGLLVEADSEEATDGAYDSAGSASIDLGALIAASSSDGEDSGSLWVDLHAAFEAAYAESEADGAMSEVEATVDATLWYESDDASSSLMAELLASLDISASSSDSDGGADDLEEVIDDIIDVLTGGGGDGGDDDGGSVAGAISTTFGVSWDDGDSAVMLGLGLAVSAEQNDDLSEALDLALSLRAAVDASVAAYAESDDAWGTGELSLEGYGDFAESAQVEVMASLMASGHFEEGDAELLSQILVQLAVTGMWED